MDDKTPSYTCPATDKLFWLSEGDIFCASVNAANQPNFKDAYAVGFEGIEEDLAAHIAAIAVQLARREGDSDAALEWRRQAEDLRVASKKSPSTCYFKSGLPIIKEAGYARINRPAITV